MSNKKPENNKKTFVGRMLFEANYQGTRAELARKLGITEQKLWNWCNIHDHIPTEHVKKLAHLIGLSDFNLAKLMLSQVDKKQ